ncbi:hypothetical protein T4A_12009, partial [Trichinella pseudospiralis]
LLVQILFASCRNLHSECSEFFTFIFSDSTGWCSLVFPISVVVILLTLVKEHCCKCIDKVCFLCVSPLNLSLLSLSLSLGQSVSFVCFHCCLIMDEPPVLEKVERKRRGRPRKSDISLPSTSRSEFQGSQMLEQPRLPRNRKPNCRLSDLMVEYEVVRHRGRRRPFPMAFHQSNNQFLKDVPFATKTVHLDSSPYDMIRSTEQPLTTPSSVSTVGTASGVESDDAPSQHQQEQQPQQEQHQDVEMLESRRFYKVYNRRPSLRRTAAMRYIGYKQRRRRRGAGSRFSRGHCTSALRLTHDFEEEPFAEETDQPPLIKREPSTLDNNGSEETFSAGESSQYRSMPPLLMETSSSSVYESSEHRFAKASQAHVSSLRAITANAPRSFSLINPPSLTPVTQPRSAVFATAVRSVRRSNPQFGIRRIVSVERSSFGSTSTLPVRNSAPRHPLYSQGLGAMLSSSFTSTATNLNCSSTNIATSSGGDTSSSLVSRPSTMSSLPMGAVIANLTLPENILDDTFASDQSNDNST